MISTRNMEVNVNVNLNINLKENTANNKQLENKMPVKLNNLVSEKKYKIWLRNKKSTCIGLLKMS